MDKRKIKKILIFFCILFIILVIVVLALNKKNKEKENENNTETPNLAGIVNESKINSINFIEYKVNKFCMQEYMDLLNSESSRYYSRNENGERVKKENATEIKQNIIDLLNKDYINENGINKSNLFDYVNTIQEKRIVFPIEITRIAEQDNMSAYKVIALSISNDLEDSEEVYAVTFIDKGNKTFSIEPIEDKDDLDRYNLNSLEKNIEKNDNNIYFDEDITGEVKTREYFNLYKYLLLVRPDIAYELLDEEYKEARFEDYEDFEDYLQNIKPRLEKMRAEKYGVNYDIEDITQYICENQFGDIYIFNEESVLDFKVILDEYSIDIAQFTETYDKAKTQEKVFLNIEKIKQALNTKDYEFVFSKLNTKFRNNNFNKVSDLEKYLSDKLPEFIKIDYQEFSNEGETYIYSLNITDLMGETDKTAYMQIVMKLKEDRDFEMSFSIK